jgi:hypothetical protein
LDGVADDNEEGIIKGVGDGKEGTICYFYRLIRMPGGQFTWPSGSADKR